MASNDHIVTGDGKAVPVRAPVDEDKMVTIPVRLPVARELNEGHGKVYSRPDRTLARCLGITGGCPECKRDYALLWESFKGTRVRIFIPGFTAPDEQGAIEKTAEEREHERLVDYARKWLDTVPDKGMQMFDLILHSYNTAQVKGWHDGKRTLVEELALMHTEISEAVEETRKPQQPMLVIGCDGDGQKPGGLAVELADTIIRICDTAMYRKIPLIEALVAKMRYNLTRPVRHGGKEL